MTRLSVGWLARHLLAAMCLAQLVPARAMAQPTVAGIVRDARFGTPLECLHVALVDTAGASVAHTVTDSAGEFLLEAPRPGIYRPKFIVQGWEPLGGAFDTLADVDFRQHAYSLAFTNMIQRGGASGPLPVEHSEAAAPEMNGNPDAVQPFEIDGTWQNRRAIPGVGPRYPNGRRRAGATGTVLAQYVIDSTGRARESSWRLIHTSHADFESAVRASLATGRWRPARNKGAPVCEMVLDFTQFSIDGNVDRIELKTR